MSEQMSIPPASVSGGETSFEAYEQVKASGLVSDLQKRVVAVLFTRGGMTANEIAVKIGVQQRDCVRPRLTELKNLDVVDVVSKKRCTVSGKVCLSWSLTGRPPRVSPVEMERCPHCNGRGKIAKITGAELEL